MASDLEYPTSPSDYADGFFAADFRNLPSTQYTNWIEPGARFDGVLKGNTNDVNTWESLTRCHRWRIRLHHQAVIKWKHESLNIFIYYHSGIPKAKKTQIKTCINPNEFEYLGDTFSAVKTKLEARQVGLTNKFFPDGKMEPVVLGWESAAL